MLIYFAVSLIALLGFCGLALDVGRMEVRSLQLQTAADNAAISYALEAGRLGNVSSSNFAAGANAELAAYAAANSIPTPTVALQSGASSGPYTGNNGVVQATVQQTMPTMMLGVLSSGSTSIQLSRTAVATMPPCATFYTTLSVSANSNLNLKCPVAVGTSLTVDASSNITGSTLVAASAGASSIAGLVNPSPLFNWPSETHPDSYATYTLSGVCQTLNISNNPAAVLSPGTYCGPNTISSSIVTLQPGYYIMIGGLAITNGSTINGGPVSMVIEKNSSNVGQFLLTSSVWNVSAPATPYGTGLGGILVACTVPVGTPNTWGPNDVQISNSTITSDGIISCGLVGATFSNSIVGDAGHFFSVVFASGSISNTTFTTSNDYSQLPGGSPHAYTVNVVQ